MLTIHNLTLAHKKDLTTLVEQLSFSVGPGERIALIGEEGNGKSTLLRAAAGDDSICDYIEISGKITNTFRTGYLPQELPAALRGLSAYEYFSGNERFFDMTPGELGAMASRLRLPADIFYSEQSMGSFSGGERVKLQLARILMDDPELLLLDEPYSALDYQTRLTVADEIWKILRASGKTAILVTHDISEAISLGDRVVILSRRPGHIIKDITIDLGSDRTPLACRSLPAFQNYFQTIWEVMQHA